MAMDAMLRKKFEIKTAILGPDPKKHVQAVKILNRIVTWERDGISWEPDPRHAELIISQLGLEGAKPLKLPGVKEETRRSEKETQELEDEVAAIFRKNEFGRRDEGPGEDCNEISSEAAEER